MSGRYALVTVSSPRFALGAAVALDSFRACNPWFVGDIVVIGGDLSDDDRVLIDRTGMTAFRAPSPRLVAAIDALCAARPNLAARRARFYSLEAFTLEGYDRVLFLDSDVVVTGDFGDLFASAGPFLAAPDSATLRGEQRDPATYARRRGEGGLATFNAGMMLFDPRALSGGYGLLAELHPGAWEAVASDHTDQLALNRWLDRRATLVDPAYNFMVGHHARGFAPAGTALEAVRMSHFNGPLKPWEPARMIAAALGSPAVRSAWSQWHRALDRMVARAHLERLAQ